MYFVEFRIKLDLLHYLELLGLKLEQLLPLKGFDPFTLLIPPEYWWKEIQILVKLLLALTLKQRAEYDEHT